MKAMTPGGVVGRPNQASGDCSGSASGDVPGVAGRDLAGAHEPGVAAVLVGAAGEPGQRRAVALGAVAGRGVGRRPREVRVVDVGPRGRLRRASVDRRAGQRGQRARVARHAAVRPAGPAGPAHRRTHRPRSAPSTPASVGGLNRPVDRHLTAGRAPPPACRRRPCRWRWSARCTWGRSPACRPPPWSNPTASSPRSRRCRRRARHRRGCSS